MILSLISKKGGVGKSTTAVNLGAALARSGKKTLIVDFDPQASASLSLGLQRSELAPSSADVLLGSTPIDRAIRETRLENLDLISASTDLSGIEERIGQLKTRESQLKARLDRCRDRYAFVLIDCPSSLTLLTTNALLAADSFLVPTTPHFLAQEGLHNLLQAGERLSRRHHAETPCCGILLTMVDRRVRLMRESADSLRERFPGKVLQAEIRFCSKLAEAPAFGQTIFEYAGTSGAAEDYDRLAEEIQREATPSLPHEDSDQTPATHRRQPASPRRSWVPGFQPSILENVS